MSSISARRMSKVDVPKFNAIESTAVTFHVFLTSELGECKKSASKPGHFTPDQRCGTH